MQTPPIDGILPLFEQRDVVGPMTKYIDDLVLVYSIMNNDSKIYETFKNLDTRNLIVGVSVNLTDDFIIPGFGHLFNNAKNVKPPGFLKLIKRTTKTDFIYKLDPEVKSSLNDTIETLKKLNLKTVDEFTYTLETFLLSAKLMGELGTSPCFFSCAKFDYDKYFNVSNRFDIDAPYHDLNELIVNPKLLSDYNRWFFEMANSSASETNCVRDCLEYNALKEELVKVYLESPEIPYYDALLVPTLTILPYTHNPDFSEAGSLFVMSTSAAYPGFAAVNVPGSYSKRTAQSPDGLPIGMLLIARPDRIVETLKIASLIENSRVGGLAKLPQNTPLIRDLSKCKEIIGNNSNKLSFYCIILVFNFFNLIMIQLYINFK